MNIKINKNATFTRMWSPVHATKNELDFYMGFYYVVVIKQ